jgi:excisionase family DNA binding protein
MEEKEERDATDLLTVQEVAEGLRISRWTVYQLIRSGQLESVKIGRRRLLLQSSLEEYVRRLRTEGAN